MQAGRDPDGFARVEANAEPSLLASRWGSEALGVIAQFLAAYGGKVEDITVGDFLVRLDLTHQERTRGVRIAYGWLRELHQFPADAPTTLRHIAIRAGQVGPAELIDRYHIACRPVRDLLVAYLTERQPSIDYNTLKNISSALGNNFWADLERHHPGIDSLHLPPEVAAAWKERLATKIVRRRQPDGTSREVREPRHNAVGIKSAVRAFYLDIALWALDAPEKWGPGAHRAPSARRSAQQRRAGSDRRRNRTSAPVSDFPYYPPWSAQLSGV
jgi:hypothetical protein